MGKCKLKDQDFKGYAYAVLLFASLSTEVLRKLKREHWTVQAWGQRL
jgi:hypothetical protein